MIKKTVRKEAGGATEKRLKVSEDMVWGVHPVLASLEHEPRQVTEVVLQKDKRGGKVDEIVALARQHGIKLVFVDSMKCTGEGAAQVRHQGIAARLSAKALLDFSVLLERMRKSIQAGERPRLMVCDSLQDPHNLGAIIRSSLASGAAAVIITRERSAPLGGTAAKSSAGALLHLDICQVTNLAESLKALKEAGFWIFGTVKDATAQSLYSVDLGVPACFVVGSEGKGLRPLVKKQCDVLISIPMVGAIDSLNSSVAAAVVLFEAFRQSGGSSAQSP